MTDQRSTAYLSELHQQIDKRFDLEEIRTLCFDLDIDYENIPGDRKSAFVRNLILSMARQGRLQEVVDKVRAERPGLSLADVPADFDLPQPIRNEDIREVAPSEYTAYIQGDYVGGDKTEVGNISNSTGIAIGPGASASVTQQSAAGSGTATSGDAFKALLALVAAEAPDYVGSVEALRRAIGGGLVENDNQIAGLVQDIVEAVPASARYIPPLLAQAKGEPGPVLAWVLSRLK